MRITCGWRIFLVGTEQRSLGVPTPRPPAHEGRTLPPQTPLRMDGWCASVGFTFTPLWILVESYLFHHQGFSHSACVFYEMLRFDGLNFLVREDGLCITSPDFNRWQFLTVGVACALRLPYWFYLGFSQEPTFR